MSSPTLPIDHSDDSGGFYAVTFLLASVATLAVALRFWARRLISQPWGIDDYLALSALILHHGVQGAAIVCVELGGLGRDTALFIMEHPNALIYLNQAVLATEVLYALSSPTIKLSVLALYWRIFPTRSMKIACIILASFCIVWAVVIGIVDFFQCRPLHALWIVELSQSPDTKCIDIVLFWLGTAAPNCAFDLITLILPIREVIRLRSSLSRKIGICAVFLLGGVAFAASLTRVVFIIILYYAGGVTNPDKQFVIPGGSTIVEVYVAVIGACLPTLIPIYRRLRYGDALKSDEAPYPRNNPIISIITIGRIRNRPRRYNITTGGSFQELGNDKSFYTMDDQHTHRVDASGNGDHGSSRNSLSDTTS
ncbi:hypothetical protein F5Y10DRAFT_285827 [Nemania abortiva]|nr:hypothetical protein F5Y10DRAFT_285827 [Nemania abortiva]